MTEKTLLPTFQPSETPSKRLANLFREMVRQNDRRDASQGSWSGDQGRDAKASGRLSPRRGRGDNSRVQDSPPEGSANLAITRR
jgi:hypothetical protein